MSFTIRLKDADGVMRKLETLPEREREGLVDLLRSEGRKIFAGAMVLSGVYGKIPRIAASSLRFERTTDGANVAVGGGGGLPAILLMGAEFGGRKRKTTYVSRSRRGTPYIVNQRRTTMQFLPHLGNRGYWFWPSVRRQLDGVMRRATDKVMEVASHG